MRDLAVGFIYFVALFFWVHQFVPLLGLAAAAAVAILSRSSAGMAKSRLVSFGFVLVYVALIAAPTLFLDPLFVSGRLIATPIVAGLALALIGPTEREINVIVQCLAISCGLVAALMYMQVGPYQLNLDPMSLLTRYRGDGYWLLGRFYEGAPTIGEPAGLALVCSIASGRRWLLAVAVVAAAILILSVSRGAIVASVGACLFLLRRPQQVLTVAALAGVAYFLLPVALEYIPSAAGRYSTMFSVSRDASMSGRLDIWAQYLNFAIANPFGSGFSFRFDELTTHNEILGHWVSAGLMGALGYLALLGHWAWRGATDRVCLSFLMFFALLGMVEFYSMSSGTLLYPLFWFIAATVLMQCRRLGIPSAGEAPPVQTTGRGLMPAVKRRTETTGSVL